MGAFFGLSLIFSNKNQIIMRFFELSLALIAAFVVVNAAPATNNGMESVNVYDYKQGSRLTGRARHQINKFEKRRNSCNSCAENRLDVDAVADAPVAAAPAPAPINRNDREGDSVNVVVNANHN